METDRLSAVTAAVLADAAFDVTGEATRFSTQRYREIIEHIRLTGEMPHQYPTPASEINISSPRQMAATHSWRQSGGVLAARHTASNRIPLLGSGLHHRGHCLNAGYPHR
jgi:hypothetical protein